MKFSDVTLNNYFVGIASFKEKEVYVFKAKSGEHEYSLFYADGENYISLNKEEKQEFLASYLPEEDAVYEISKYKITQKSGSSYSLMLKLNSGKMNDSFQNKKTTHSFFIKNLSPVENTNESLIKNFSMVFVREIENLLKFIGGLGLSEEEFEKIKSKLDDNVAIYITSESDKRYAANLKTYIFNSLKFYQSAFVNGIVSPQVVAHELAHLFSCSQERLNTIGFKIKDNYTAFNEMITDYIGECASGVYQGFGYKFERYILNYIFSDNFVPKEVLQCYFKNDPKTAIEFISKFSKCPSGIIDELLLMCDHKLYIDLEKDSSVHKDILLSKHEMFISMQMNLFDFGKKVDYFNFEDLHNYEKKLLEYSQYSNRYGIKEHLIDDYNLISRAKCLFEKHSKINFNCLTSCLKKANSPSADMKLVFADFCEIFREKEYDPKLIEYCAYICPKMFFENLKFFTTEFADTCNVQIIKDQIVKEIVYKQIQSDMPRKNDRMYSIGNIGESSIREILFDEGYLKSKDGRICDCEFSEDISNQSIKGDEKALDL